VKEAGDDIEGRIVAKLDYLNPGFSKKDRIAKQIIDRESFWKQVLLTRGEYGLNEN